MRHLITAGLPYINGVKHLGNLVGSLLPADVYARFLRQQGHEVLYICATDEHGAPAELAAAQAGLPVDQYCAQQYQVQKDIYNRFGIAFDYFGRSSSRENAELTQHIASVLKQNGYIVPRSMSQIYSVGDKRFLPDRYVTGTCPHCGYEAARGDQCENCTKLLEPTELINPKSTISGDTLLETRTSRHLFLDLPALEPLIRKWIHSRQEKWPPLTRQITHKWLNEGLQPRCITRDLAWGVPVPFKGFEDKVFYVWFDAPIEYIAATREYFVTRGEPDSWKSWWLNANVSYTQFIGKDNLPFHTIMFPGMLLGTREAWKLADHIKGFHWLNYYGGKFSTSLRQGVFTDAALEYYPPDYWRYFLMANAPESADSTFTWELFSQTVNKDLGGVLGNLVNRVIRFCHSKFHGIVPTGGIPGQSERKLSDECSEEVYKYQNALNKLQFRTAMRALRKLWTLGNLYIDERAPWIALRNGDREGAALTVRMSLNLLKLFAAAGEPVIPHISSQIQDALGLRADERCGGASQHLDLEAIEAGRPIRLVPPLVKLLEPEEVGRMRQRFG